jgi:ABC-type multidrug transport system ATPase subunit
MIEIKNLSFSRPTKTIFTNFNASLQSNMLTLLTGLNGSGKTTLINLIGGSLSHILDASLLMGSILPTSQLVNNRVFARLRHNDESSILPLPSMKFSPSSQLLNVRRMRQMCVMR